MAVFFRTISAEKTRAKPRKGPPWRLSAQRREHRGEHRRGRDDDRPGAAAAEIKTVLGLLQEGKISVEDAEKLIAALRR